MKRFLLAGAALSLLAVAAPARSQSIGTVAIAGDTCPATTQYPIGNNRPLILTQTGILCTSGSGGGGGGGAVTGASGSFVDGWSVTDGSTTDVVCSTDTGTCTNVALFKKMNVGISALVAAIGSSIPAGSAVIGVTGVTIGSTTSGQSGELVQCATTTSSPTNTTAQTNPLSCDTTGALRISAPAASPVNVNVTTPPNDVLTGPTSLTGAGDVTVNAQGSGAAALQITGTYTGLAGVIRGSVDGTNYVNIGSYNANTGAVIVSGTSITANAIYIIPAAGYRTIQYHVTAVSTGTAVVNLNSSAGALDPPSSVSSNGKNVNVTNLPTTVDTNAGAAGASTIRTVIATGGATVPISAASLPLPTGAMGSSGGTVGLVAGSAVIGHVITDTGSTTVVTGTVTDNSTLQTQTDTVMVGGVNVKEINAVTPLMGNGTTGTGSQRVTIASDNTAFSVNATATNAGTFAVQSQPTPVTSGGLSTFSEIVPANTTSVAVKASAGQIYDIEMGSNSATPLSNPLYVKFYDASQGSTTCGSGTPKSRYVFSGGSNVSIPLGEAFATAVTVCVTAGIADNDATSPAATTFLLTVHYK